MIIPIFAIKRLREDILHHKNITEIIKNPQQVIKYVLYGDKHQFLSKNSIKQLSHVVIHRNQHIVIIQIIDEAFDRFRPG